MIKIAGEENQLILCPYDKSHSIRLARMQVHLIKCRRNHLSKKVEIVKCPFNITHMVNKMELDVHVKICPQRIGFERFRMTDELVSETLPNSEVSLNESVVSSDTLKIASMIESSNDWDYEPDVPSYNPTAYAKSARVLRQPCGLKPSERREFRAKERERLQKGPE